MHYDFETVIDRSRCGSIKWNAMRELDPAVPAGIVPLSIGDMELKNPPEFAARLKEYVDKNILGYTAPAPAYRGAVRDWFRRRHGWRVDSDWIVTHDGVVPAMCTAIQAYTEPGDGVVYMPPVYYPMRQSIVDNQRRAVPVPLVESAGGYAMDFAGLEKAAADPKTKLILFCSPHNPVARVWRRDELERLGEICLKHDVVVLSDEVHMDFAMPGHQHTVFSAISPEFAAHSVICTAPSKTFNLAGLQVSNIIISDHELRRRFCRIREMGGRHDANQLGLAACQIVYEHCEGWLDAALELIRQNGELVRAFMAGHFPEVRMHSHEGTYFVWLDFRQWGLDKAGLEKFMVEKARLFLDEGYIFGEGGDGFERINVACPTRVLSEALERLRLAKTEN